MKVTAIVNQKGGVGKTTTAFNLGVGLVREGKKVLIIDADPQGNLTYMAGFADPDSMTHTLPELMTKIVNNDEYNPDDYIHHASEGVDIVASNISLSATEVFLINAMSREMILKTFIDEISERYDYVLIDCMPSLSVITINALCAANSVIIPMQPAFLSVKGLEQLVKNIWLIKKRLNRSLVIDGILLTMVDGRTNVSKSIVTQVRETCKNSIDLPSFFTYIPASVKAVEASSGEESGGSLFKYDPRGRVAEAYKELVGEFFEREA